MATTYPRAAHPYFIVLPPWELPFDDTPDAVCVYDFAGWRLVCVLPPNVVPPGCIPVLVRHGGMPFTSTQAGILVVPGLVHHIVLLT